MTLITAAVLEVPFCKKGYVNSLHRFATELEAVHLEFQAALCELENQKAVVGERELDVQLLTDDAGKAPDLLRLLCVIEVELAFRKSVLDANENTLKARDRDCGQRNYSSGSAWAAVIQRKRFIRNIAEHICTRYAMSMCKQAGDFRDYLNALLADERLRSEYLGCCRVPVHADGHSLAWEILIVTR